MGIGDVTGHGLESGMVMLMTQMGIRTLLEHAQHAPSDCSPLSTAVCTIARMQADKSDLDAVALSTHHQRSLAARCASADNMKRCW